MNTPLATFTTSGTSVSGGSVTVSGCTFSGPSSIGGGTCHLCGADQKKRVVTTAKHVKTEVLYECGTLYRSWKKRMVISGKNCI